MQRSIHPWFALLLVGLLPQTVHAQTAAADKAGNLFFTDAAGKRTQLTAESRDSAPSLDPAKRRVVFVRATPGQTVDVGIGDVEATELWIVDVDGHNATMLLRGKANQKMEKFWAAWMCRSSRPTAARSTSRAWPG